MIERTYQKVTVNGRVIKEFNPFICYRFMKGIYEIGFRGDFGITIFWGYTIGNWSRIRHRHIKIGELTLCLNLGRCDPYNPITGETHE